MKTMATKKEYIQTLRIRYVNANNRRSKSLIIDEVCANLSKDRKSVIKILNGKGFQDRRRKPVRRPVKYEYKLHIPLSQIWEIAGKPCSINLKPKIPELIKKLEQFEEIKIYEKEKILLCSMSTFTIDRLLKVGRHRQVGKGVNGTKKSPLLKSLIPIRTNFHEVKEPGHLEQDCVLHCGNSNSGTFAETLNTMDIDTHWLELSAFLHKTNVKTIGAFHEQIDRFPFKIKSTDFDNGIEFVNWKMKEYCDKSKILYTRSRSYHKNDQAHIEERNGHRVRNYIGYGRIETQDIVDLLNNIYQNEFRLLNNFFFSTRKLKEKKKVDKKYSKKYEVAKTPYERVLASKTIKGITKIRLMQEYYKLNPAELKRNLDIKLMKLNEMIWVSKTNLSTTQEK